MKKSEIVIFGSLSLVFVLVMFTIKDIVRSDSMAINGLIAAGAGLFAFWWAFRFLPRFKTAAQFFFTLSLVSSLLLVAFVFNSTGGKQSPNVVDLAQLRGTWISPAEDADDNELILQISDSLTVFIDKEPQRFGYKIKENQFTVLDLDSEVVHDWKIIGLDSNSMVIGDDKHSLVFSKMD
jgi:hypothetical protein